MRMRAEASARAARPRRCFLSAGGGLGLALEGGATRSPAHRPGRERSFPGESATWFFQLFRTVAGGSHPTPKLSRRALGFFASRKREVFPCFSVCLS